MKSTATEQASDEDVLIRLLNDADDATITYDSAKVQLWLTADRKLMANRFLDRYLRRRDRHNEGQR